LAAAVAQAKASVASAQAKVDSDESNGASDTQTAADEAALTAAQNQLSSANSQLSAARLTSPIDGVVADLNLTVGQAVSGSGSSNGGNNGSSGGSSGGNSPAGGSSSSSSSAQALVISQQSWIVNATVDATSVGLIKVGNQAQLTVDGVTDTVYGTIAQIGLVSSSSSGTASYPVVIDVTGNPAGLHDGASVTATLIYKQLANVLVIPATALHRDTSGTYVEKVQNGKTVKATVTTGISSGAQVQIVSGLGAGDTIVVPQAGFGRTANSNGNTNRTGRTGGTGNFPAGGGNFPAGGGNFPAGGGNFPAGGGNFPAGGFPGGGSRGGN
jgi:multidrug efflux pump subunit AcrA (membrane-fusion protein)